MRRVMALALVIGMALVGCATADDRPATTSTPSTSAPTTETTPTTPTTTVTTATTTTTAPDEIVVSRNVPYVTTGDSGDLTVDIYAPASGGPWPVLVAYHGGVGPDKAAVAGLARRLAEAGAVVFAPEWRGLPFSAASMEALLSESACSLWFAARHAADHGGDPTDLSVFGISAGAAKAAAVTLYPSTEHEGCVVPAADVEVRHLILHEGGFGFHPGYDDIFRDNPGLFDATTVWSHLGSPTTTEIHLLADERTVADTWYDATTYIRPPTGGIEDAMTIRGPGFFNDAVRLGLLDDDEVNIAEISVILEDHMLAAGHDVTLTWFDDGSHAITGSVIGYTVDVVTTD